VTLVGWLAGWLVGWLAGWLERGPRGASGLLRLGGDLGAGLLTARPVPNALPRSG
jgi:hypothetical protein